MADDLEENNQDDDFDFSEGDDNFDEFKDENFAGGGVQNNALVKAGIIAGVFLFIVAGFLLFGGSEEKSSQSQVSATSGAGVSEAPATAEVSPSYEEAIQDYNEEGVETAEKERESFIPVPTDPPRDTGISVPDETEVQQDPLERWRILQEQRSEERQEGIQSQQQQALDDGPSPEDQRRQEAVETLASSMLNSMQQLGDKSLVRNMNSSKITTDAYIEEQLADEEEDGAGKTVSERIEEKATPPVVILSEGEIEYAQMLIQANSDIPGPVLAQIVTGPMAGSRIIGSFSREKDYLVIEFSTVIVDGQSVPINAVAVDPNTNLTGVATDVDRRYFKRLILPVAAEFITGLAGAIAETQTATTVTDSAVVVDETELDTDEEVAAAIEDTGEEVGDFLDEQSDETEILVRVAAGTPVGVLFLEPVLEEQTTPTTDVAETE